VDVNIVLILLSCDVRTSHCDLVWGGCIRSLRATPGLEPGCLPVWRVLLLLLSRAGAPGPVGFTTENPQSFR